MFGSLVSDGSSKYIGTKEDIYFNIADLGEVSLVVSYKINGSEDRTKTAFFDSATGFWKLGRQRLNLNPCDEFEVTIEQFCLLNIKVKDSYNSSNLYSGNYTLEVEKTNDGILFPKSSNGKIAINYGKMNNSKKYYTLYATQGTRLKFDMKLDANKEIAEWAGDFVTPQSGVFNFHADHADLKIGKKLFGFIIGLIKMVKHFH